MQLPAITFRLSPELKQAAEQCALAEDRSLSSLSKRALAYYLEAKGMLCQPTRERELFPWPEA